MLLSQIPVSWIHTEKTFTGCIQKLNCNRNNKHILIKIMNLQKSFFQVSLLFVLGCAENENDRIVEFNPGDNPPNILFAISDDQSFLTDNYDQPEVSKFFHLAVDKRPAEELYDIISDPGCLNNLANEASYQDILTDHRRRLGAFLMETEDPRVTGRGDIYEEFPRYGPMREFQKPDWAKESSR